MSISVEVDEEILRKAEDASHIHDHSELVRRALETFTLRREAQKRLAATSSEAAPVPATREEAYRFLAAIGGSMPELELPRRRRVEDYQ
jgi:hypothetical protein